LFCDKNSDDEMYNSFVAGYQRGRKSHGHPYNVVLTVCVLNSNIHFIQVCTSSLVKTTNIG